MTAQFDRRQMLRGLALGGFALAAPGVLAACGSSGSGSGSSSGSGGFGIASQRLAWIKNTEFAGSFLADKNGYYKAAGFSGSDLISGGPTAPPIESDVLSRTFAGVSQVPIVAAAIAQGAPLKIIGAVYQRYAGGIISMTAKPIRTPNDLYGKTIGCASSSEPVWRSFLAALKLDTSRIKTVPVQGDPIGITKGEIDGYLGFVNAQAIDMRHQGFDVTTMLLADVGFPLVGQTYITTQDNIDKNRAKVKAFLKAEIQGWQDVLANPQLATDVTVNEYGKDLKLDPKATLDSCKSGNDLIRNSDPHQQIITISDQAVAENLKSIAAGGMKLDAGKLFELGPIREVYKENPSLAL